MKRVLPELTRSSHGGHGMHQKANGQTVAGWLGVWGMVVCALMCLSCKGSAEHSSMPATMPDAGEAAMYEYKGRKVSIESWQVNLTGPGADAQDVVVMFKCGGYEGYSGGFAVWRDGQEVYTRPLHGLRYGWNRTTDVELSGGRPVDAEVMDRLLALESDIRSLPHVSSGSSDPYECFLYIRQGGVTRKYFWDTGDMSDELYLRIKRQTEGLWLERK